MATTQIIPVVFVYADWEAMFPEFAGVDEAAATGYFNLATMYIRNDGCGPVDDPIMLTNLLYLTTAHIARLFSAQNNGVSTTGGSGPAGGGLVGRISGATEGSVSVQTELGNLPMSAAWWIQTEYGFTVWQMLAPFRTARYIPGPRRIFNPLVWGRGRYIGPGW